MLTVYCDVNVYNDVERGAISGEEVGAFREARARGDITVRLSLPDIEEALGVWRTDSATACKRLRIAEDLAGFGGLLKQPSDLLADAFRAYAAGSPAPSPLLRRAERLHLGRIFGKIAAGGGLKYARKIAEVLSDVKAQKETFKLTMSEAGAESFAALSAKHAKKDLSKVSFAEFFALGIENWASDFADHIGAGHACRERGLAGLVSLPTVRLGIGSMLSLVHSQMCAGREPDFGDKYDVWHVVQASTADVFVTREKRLYEHVERIPDVPGFLVVRSLAAALSAVGMT